MVVGLYGKHPAKGDFLQAGLPAPLLSALEIWLDAVLSDLRETLGPEWQYTWSRAPMLRFWFGEGIWGGPVAGVMAASQDRVGRRFPLVLIAAGPEAPAPPISDPAQGWHDAAAGFLAASLGRSDFATPSELLQDAPRPEAPEGISQNPVADFWAVRPGNAIAALWLDVVATDHRRSASGRSYWWVAGEDGPDVAAEPDPPAPDAPAVEPPQSSWNLPPPEAEDSAASPFVGTPSTTGLFAAPEMASEAAGGSESAPEAHQHPKPALRDPLWSQVWAGEGLPSGSVLAWLMRGHVGHG